MIKDGHLRSFINVIRPFQKGLITLSVIIVLTVSMHSLPGGDDWVTSRGTALRILQNTPLYQQPVTFSYFYYPPWIGVLFVPFTILPIDWGRGVLSAITLVALFYLGKRWNIRPINTPCIYLSPPVLYTLLHGQIDGLIVCAVLLPVDWWFVAAITKPQIAIGLVGNIFYSRRWQSIAIFIIVMAISLLIFGLWPLEIIKLPFPFVNGGHNLWKNFWPMQIPIGVGLFLTGIRNHDEKFLIASSPFFSPYCPISSLIGPWILLVSKIETWILYVILISWWGVLIIPGILR